MSGNTVWSFIIPCKVAYILNLHLFGLGSQFEVLTLLDLKIQCFNVLQFRFPKQSYGLQLIMEFAFLECFLDMIYINKVFLFPHQIKVFSISWFLLELKYSWIVFIIKKPQTRKLLIELILIIVVLWTPKDQRIKKAVLYVG